VRVKARGGVTSGALCRDDVICFVEFWLHAGNRVGVDFVPASEAGSILRRIGRQGDFGIGGGSYPADQASRQVEFLLLFDSHTSNWFPTMGLVLITPQRGKIGVFGGVSALYIGAGW
jgi:hypothetical protein